MPDERLNFLGRLQLFPCFCFECFIWSDGVFSGWVKYWKETVFLSFCYLKEPITTDLTWVLHRMQKYFLGINVQTPDFIGHWPLNLLQLPHAIENCTRKYALWVPYLSLDPIGDAFYLVEVKRLWSKKPLFKSAFRSSNWVAYLQPTLRKEILNWRVAIFSCPVWRKPQK